MLSKVVPLVEHLQDCCAVIFEMTLMVKMVDWPSCLGKLFIPSEPLFPIYDRVEYCPPLRASVIRNDNATISHSVPGTQQVLKKLNPIYIYISHFIIYKGFVCFHTLLWSSTMEGISSLESIHKQQWSFTESSKLFRMLLYEFLVLLLNILLCNNVCKGKVTNIVPHYLIIKYKNRALEAGSWAGSHERTMKGILMFL